MKIPAIETANPSKIKAFQDQELQKLLHYLALNSPYYQRTFKEHNIDISSIKTLEDLPKLPLTTKQDLQENNDAFICVDRRKIIDYVTTSGTMGKPVTFALTDKDLDRLAYNEATSFASAGIDDTDILLLTTTIDRRFMAGLAYFLGARKLGAGIVRVGSGLPALQWDTIKRVSPTALIAVPSFIFKLIEYAKKNGIDYKNSSIKKAICIGESLRNPDFSLNTLGQKITDLWDIELYSTYASTEMSTAFTECSHSRGGHHHPELILVEILDEHGQAVAEGEAGEVVISTLQMEAMPLLRFKTGDICQWYQDACPCGRTTLRLGPVIGRKGQMIKYKGTTLYPPALYNLLNQFEAIKAFVIEVFTNDIGTDEIVIKVASKDTSTRFQKRVKDHFRAKLRVAPKVEFTSFETINALRFPAMSRKPVLFFDHR
ncbi:phenylacetate--CoA ligase family protein [Aureispira sp. CCB-QB1]|uniref:phenylacetate--CoA ligase family protein n=1 Tax=Aureispira sp. CCB-QB1 TaxID=1313421 RepID=UPI000696E420|nr:AMP-binding protein [Aureispira sp. CCB-QB1]